MLIRLSRKLLSVVFRLDEGAELKALRVDNSPLKALLYDRVAIDGPLNLSPYICHNQHTRAAISYSYPLATTSLNQFARNGIAENR